MVGNDVRILNFYAAPTYTGEPRAYISINTRKVIPELIENKIRVASTNLTFHGPKIVVPQHPYQLVVTSSQLPSKSTLDKYVQKKFGLRESVLLNSNTYSFIVKGGWKKTEKAIAEWDISTMGIAPSSHPQLLYHFNTMKPK